MFGYLVPDYRSLSKDLMREYRARYCGLCRTIGARYGMTLRHALSYEMTFLVLLLDALTDTEALPLSRCIKHPFSKAETPNAPHLVYAADLTVLLLGAKLADNVADDNSRLSAFLSHLLSSKLEKASAASEQAAAQIADSLQLLAQTEQRNELNPEIPAAIFGELVGKLLVDGMMTEDAHKASAHIAEKAPAAFALGTALGKLLYLLDAVKDLRADLKHERYNPLVAIAPALHAPMLRLYADELLTTLSALPESPLTPLLDGLVTHAVSNALAEVARRTEKPT